MPSLPAFRSLVVLLTLGCFALSTLTAQAAGLSSGLNPDLGNVREFYSSNHDNRMLIRVQFWGDIGLAGIHYIPDNTTLLELVGYAGGPTGPLEKSTITVNRLPSTKSSQAKEMEINGKDLVTTSSYRSLTLNNGDILYMDSPPKVDNFVRTLSVVSTILGIVATSLTIYLVLRPTH